MFGVDEAGADLRSVSKAEDHYDSFNRHFPVARLTSKTTEVQQVCVDGLGKSWERRRAAWGRTRAADSGFLFSVGTHRHHASGGRK